MIDLFAARLIVSLYGYAGGEIFTWDHLSSGSICYGVKHVLGVNYVIFRGTDNASDFLRDLQAYTSDDSDLGPVYAGFLTGMREASKDILARVSGPIVVAGHSLGAARAIVFCGFAKLRGAQIIKRVTLGEPWACGQRLATLVSDIPASPYRAVQNGAHDSITDLPPQFLSFFDFYRPSPLRDLPVKVTPRAKRHLPLFPLHFCEGYADALNLLHQKGHDDDDVRSRA